MFYIRRIQGVSLQPTLKPGQMVIFSRGWRWRQGQIVLAQIDGQEVVKLLIKQTHHGYQLAGLHPTSSRYLVTSQNLKGKLILKGLCLSYNK